MSRILRGEAKVAVDRLCLQGERHAACGEFGEALACFVEAWEQLPEPHETYEETGRVLRGFTRVMRARGDLAEGLELLLAARSHCRPALMSMAGGREH